MSDEQIARAARLWRKGCHTLSIARCLKLAEAEVYNLIGRIKAVE